MCAAFANSGTLVQPHFLDRVVDAGGKLVQAAEPHRRPVGASSETLRAVREGMRRVVQSGTARQVGVQEFDAAAKTGTAEIGELNHAWFAGFAPFDSPKVSFVIVSERTSVHGGSGTGPIMARVMKEIWPEVEKMP